MWWKARFGIEVWRGIAIRHAPKHPNVDHVRDILENLKIDLGDGVAGWFAVWKRGLYSE